MHQRNGANRLQAGGDFAQLQVHPVTGFADQRRNHLAGRFQRQQQAIKVHHCMMGKRGNALLVEVTLGNKAKSEGQYQRDNARQHADRGAPLSIAFNDPLSRLHAPIACNIPGLIAMPAQLKCSGKLLSLCTNGGEYS